MPSVEELLGMDAREAYGHAVRAGIEIAIKWEALGIEEDALKKWFSEHPEFADEKVHEHICNGAAEDFGEILERIKQLPGHVSLLNLGGNGTVYDIK